MITKQVEVTRVFEENIYANKTIVVNVGGARSSKSHSITQVMIQKFINEKKKDFLTTRKTNPALKNTAYKAAIKLLKEYKYYNGLVHNKTDQTIHNPKNGNVWLFTSIDNPERIKSTEFNYIHMEEASEFTYDDFMILKLRLSGKCEDGEQNHMYLSLNPSDRNGWIKEELMEKWDIDLIESTFLDAIEFLPAEYVSELEGLKEQDPEYYEVYALGKWAELSGIIWGKPEILREFPETKETIYGMDFGYNHPSVLIEVGIDMDLMALYLRELIYETHLTNNQLIDKMKDAIPVDARHREIYADSAEPARIEEIHRAGFNIKAADKGKDSVINGIDMVKRFKLYSLESNIHLNPEFGGYKNKVDKNGKILDEPVKFNDDSCDATRYPVYTHMKERFEALGPGRVYHKGQEKAAAKAPMILADLKLAEKTRQMIAKYGYAALGAFAYSLSMQEGDLRLRLVKLGFNEHKPNRFIYGDNFKMPEKPAEKPESKKMREEQEGWVV